MYALPVPGPNPRMPEVLTKLAIVAAILGAPFFADAAPTVVSWPVEHWLVFLGELGAASYVVATFWRKIIRPMVKAAHVVLSLDERLGAEVQGAIRQVGEIKEQADERFRKLESGLAGQAALTMTVARRLERIEEQLGIQADGSG